MPVRFIQADSQSSLALSGLALSGFMLSGFMLSGFIQAEVNPDGFARADFTRTGVAWLS
jgi:hypothetical protein